jgi:phosphoglycolate phosphatase-like HAD superfamily hydrolase
MDGTLCLPQNHMFGQMRAALDIPKSKDIIAHINELPSSEQPDAWTKIKQIEQTAMREQEAQPGLIPLLEFLHRENVRVAICTRNFEDPVRHFLENFVAGKVNGTEEKVFDPVVTRDFTPAKPHPAGIWECARAWGVRSAKSSDREDHMEEGGPVEERVDLPMIMVGDSVDDMAAGRAAGCVTVLLKSQGKEELEVDGRTDLVVGRLDELVEILQQGLWVDGKQG